MVENAYNIADLRKLAKRRLPRGLFEFVDRGTEDEVALANNRQAFDRLKLRPRQLTDVSKREQSVTLFGRTQPSPLAIAPTGLAGLMWHDGEMALARAAAAAGVPFTLSTSSVTKMERLVAEVAGRMWFQLYMFGDRGMSHRLVERAERAGFEALIVTVDVPVGSNREYNLRNGFTLPFSVTPRNFVDIATHPGWLVNVLGRYWAATGMPKYENYPPEMQAKVTAQPVGRGMKKNDSLTWDDLRTLREKWPRILIVKGIMEVEDALKAIECGADGIVVSNHGGRMLDATMAAIDVLPEIVDAVAGRTEILVDSGFRRGSDVVKALALGASGVLLGRAPLYGVAAGGEAGAARTLEIFREEIARVMGLIGSRCVAEIGREHLHPAPATTHGKTRFAAEEAAE